MTMIIEFFSAHFMPSVCGDPLSIVIVWKWSCPCSSCWSPIAMLEQSRVDLRGKSLPANNDPNNNGRALFQLS